MYGRRLKVLLAICAFVALLCIARLAQMQLLSNSWYRARIAELQQSTVKRLPATRGSILDRNGRVLAADELSFDLCMTYALTSAIDERTIAPGEKAAAQAQENLAHLDSVIEKCARIFGTDPADIVAKTRARNERIWTMKLFQAWRDACPDSELLSNPQPESIPFDEAMADFERQVPDPARRTELARRIDLAEMNENWPFLPLKTTDDLLAAQLEFMDTPGIDVAPRVTRSYPFRDSAAQIIGWVGPVGERYQLPLDDDEFRSYAPGELCGRSAVEYVCEAVLRGRRGQRVYDFDRNIIKEVERRQGMDVTLTLDIELQKNIEQLIRDPAKNPNSASPTAIVIIDVITDEILALVSLPSYDLSTIRQNYGKVREEPGTPLLSRTLECLYPPGSVTKPLILIAGLESGAISRTEAISCPSHAAPAGWPSCWIWRQSHIGHDEMWSNSSVNAIRGSCNIYFSHLAHRLDAAVLQLWLLKFGYGSKVLARQDLSSQLPDASENASLPRRYLPERAGIVHSGDPGAPTDAEVLPPIADHEKKMFGIGQGSFRVTPIEVAAAMASISRRGRYRAPRLFVSASRTSEDTHDLGISPETIDTVRDGMYAVVNEDGGTANRVFQSGQFRSAGVSVFGKTGSTQAPEHAWFGGFAEDRMGRSLAMAIVIEGGQSGGSDASPLARDILMLCVEAGYLGPRARESKIESRE
jgi:penicillin-binding protein 2